MQHWIRKFRNAFRGIAIGMQGESSFVVHIPVAIAVVVLASLLQCSFWQWCVLMLCIGMVLTLELMNSGMEHMAKGLCSRQNEEVGRALDIASGAVLTASIVAAGIGLAILGTRFWTMLYS